METAAGNTSIEELLIKDDGDGHKQKKTKSVLLKLFPVLWRKKVASTKGSSTGFHLKCPYDDLLDASYLDTEHLELALNDISTLSDTKSEHEVLRSCKLADMKNITQDEVTVASTPNTDDLWADNNGWVTGDLNLFSTKSLGMISMTNKKNFNKNDWFDEDDDGQEVEKVNRKLFYDEDSVRGGELQANEETCYTTPRKNILMVNDAETFKDHVAFDTASYTIHESDINPIPHDGTDDTPSNDAKEQGQIRVNSETNPHSVKLEDLLDAAKDVIDALYIYEQWRRTDKTNNHSFQDCATECQENWSIKKKPLKTGVGTSKWIYDGCSEATEMGTELQYKTPKKTKSARRLTQTTIVLPNCENHRCEIVSSSPSTIMGADRNLNDSDVFSSIDSVDTSCSHKEDTTDAQISRKDGMIIHDQEGFSPTKQLTTNSYSNVPGNCSAVNDEENQMIQPPSYDAYDDSFSVDNFPSPVWYNQSTEQTDESFVQDMINSSARNNSEEGNKLRDLTATFTHAKTLLESLQHLHIHRDEGAASHIGHGARARVVLETMKNECNLRLERNMNKVHAGADLVEASNMNLSVSKESVSREKITKHPSPSREPLNDHPSSLMIANRIAQLRQSLSI
jgi:hypothetical protein